MVSKFIVREKEPENTGIGMGEKEFQAKQKLIKQFITDKQKIGLIFSREAHGILNKFLNNQP